MTSMYKSNGRKKKKKSKPKSVSSQDAASVRSELSDPSAYDDDESSYETDTLSIPEAIEEASLSGDEDSHERSKSKKTKKSVSTEEDLSSKKKKKKKKSYDEGSKTSRKKSKKAKKKIYDDYDEYEEELEELEEENQMLAEEVADLRRRLNTRSDNMELEQLQMDLKRAENEAEELRLEMDEYEEAVAEKDTLIKKLTEAVDCQLDKVEYLELKLQRAEDEFINMEDEMQEMEDEIEELRVASVMGDNKSHHSGLGIGDDLDDREAELEDKENALVMREQELLEREKELVDREDEIADLREKLDDEKAELRMKQLQLEEKDRDAQHTSSSTDPGYGGFRSGIGGNTHLLQARQEEINNLKRDLALKTGEVHELRGQLNRQANGGVDRYAPPESDSDILRQENARLKERVLFLEANERNVAADQDDQMKEMKLGVNKQLQELVSENKTLQGTIEKLTWENEDLRGDGFRDQVNQQLFEKDEQAKRQREEIDQVWKENESLKEELNELKSSMKGSSAEVAETKRAIDRKMKQKDETITFMQGEMVRLTMEKQETEKKLHQKVREFEVFQEASNAGDDLEAEMQRIQAFNEQIRVLDEEKLAVQHELEKVKSDHKLALKEKDAKILEAEEDLADLKRAIQAHKTGNTVTLLDERNAMKDQLKAAKQDLVEIKVQVSKMEKKKKEISSLEKKLKKERESNTEALRMKNERIEKLEKLLDEKNGNAGLGIFGLGKGEAQNNNTEPVGVRGLWSALSMGAPAARETAFDRNNRDNMAGAGMKETTHNEGQKMVPILTGQAQSMEDELKAIEAQVSKKKREKKTGPTFEESYYSMNVKDRLKALREKRAELESDDGSAAKSTKTKKKKKKDKKKSKDPSSPKSKRSIVPNLE